MARKLAKSTLERLARKLQAERERLEAILDEFERQREQSTSSEAQQARHNWRRTCSYPHMQANIQTFRDV